jgi:hypothetical protein
MEEFIDPDKPDPSVTEARVYKKPIHLFLIRCLGFFMILGAVYNLFEKIGLGANELLLMSKDRPTEFIFGVILSGVISLFCGIGIILLSDTSRQATMVTVVPYILANIRLLLGDPASMAAGKERLAFLIGGNARLLLIILIVYQAVWVYFFSRDYVRERFVFKEQKGYLLVGLVFLLSVYSCWFDLGAIYRSINYRQPPVQKKQPASPPGKSASGLPAKNSAPPAPVLPKVKGVLASRGSYSVMIDNKFYNIGDRICGGTIVDIMPDRVSVQFPGGQKEFTIGSSITGGAQ